MGVNRFSWPETHAFVTCQSEKSIEDMSASVTSVSTSTIATIQLEAELTSAKAEIMKKDKAIEDLQEKLDTIMAKRGEDRDKIREFEKTKLQLEQLLEYKARITESQADLQKQLAQVRFSKAMLVEILPRRDESRNSKYHAAIKQMDSLAGQERGARCDRREKSAC